MQAGGCWCAVGSERMASSLVSIRSMHAQLDLVADRADLLQREAGRVGDVPRLDGGRDVRAHVAAAHRDRPVGVQLQLADQLARLSIGEIDPDLGHRFDDLGQTWRAGF